MANELSIPERVAVLETKMATVETLLNQIDSKLDDLIQLKAKGLGAISLVGLIASSGIVGLVVWVWSIFSSRPHL